MAAKITVTNTKHCAPTPQVPSPLTPRTDIGCMQQQRSIAQYDRTQVHHSLRLKDFQGTRASAQQHHFIVKCLIAEGYRRRRALSASAQRKEERSVVLRRARATLSECFGSVEGQNIIHDGYFEALHEVRRWGLFFGITSAP